MRNILLVALVIGRRRHKKPDLFLGFLEHQEICRTFWGFLGKKWISVDF